MEQTMDPDQAEEQTEQLTVKYEELKHRFARYSLLEQVWTDCSRILLSNESLDRALAKVLAKIKSATGCSSASIREIKMDSDEKPMLHTRHEAYSPQHSRGNYKSSKILPLSIYSQNAIDAFSAGKAYGGNVADLSEEETPYFSDQGIFSFLSLPVKVGGKWWGLLTLEYALHKTSIDLEDIRLLSICSDMLGGFFQRHQTEKALRTGEKKLRLLADNTLDCIWRMDMNLIFTYVNPAVKTMFGFEPKAWIGSPLSAHCSQAEMNKMINIISAYMEDPRDQSGVLFETTLKHANGSEVPVEILGKYLLNSNGELVGLQGTTRDISERKEAEKERQRLGAQLRHSQKMEAMGTLAGGIAHDFNNILTAIIGYAELSLMDAEENSRLSNNLQEIYRAGNRATELVKQILTFCRQTEHERQPIQISPIVKEALKLLRSSIPATIEISQSIDDNLAATMADATQIHQIVMNLCTNAAQAMEKSGGRLVVALEHAVLGTHFRTMHPDVESGNYIQLTVSDTGHGIPPNIIEKIFDPYFTTKKMGEGTGLGLSVIQGIIKSYGGEITVESIPGQGTIFRVYFPESDDAALEEETAASVLPIGDQRILFVDDEPALVDMGQQRLSRLGYKVEACTSSVEALSLFQDDSARFDLVITDMAMPVLSGDRLAKRLIEIRPGIPIILCTGFSKHISNEKAAACGIRAFLMKPITIKEMADTVKRVLLQSENES